MCKSIRIIVLLAVLFAGIFTADDHRPEVVAGDGFLFLMIVYLVSTLGSAFAGCIGVTFAGNGAHLRRPRLAAPFFAGRSPLQFPWFAGFIFFSYGAGSAFRGILVGLSMDGLLVLSAGLGFLTGCRVVMSVFRRRFDQVGW
jgi:hypothetical protein